MCMRKAKCTFSHLLQIVVVVAGVDVVVLLLVGCAHHRDVDVVGFVTGG